jgi:hypothetical protein
MQADRQGGYGRSVVEALLAEVRRLQELVAVHQRTVIQLGDAYLRTVEYAEQLEEAWRACMESKREG